MFSLSDPAPTKKTFFPLYYLMITGEIGRYGGDYQDLIIQDQVIFITCDIKF